VNGTVALDAQKIVLDEAMLRKGDVKVMDYSHRCDRCGARAYIRAYKTGETNENRKLLFCGHHGRTYEASLIGQGFNTEDQTIMLYKVAKPDASA
jgi:hypothetical protein